MSGWKGQSETQVEVDVYPDEKDGLVGVVELWADRDRMSESDGESEVQVASSSIGLLPEGAYDKHLSPWVAALRRRIMRNLAWESEVLAAMQVCASCLRASAGALNRCCSGESVRRSWMHTLSIHPLWAPIRSS